MKLLRYESGEGVALGVLQPGSEGRIVPLAPLSGEFPTMLSIINGGSAALDRIRALAMLGDGAFDLAKARR